MKTVSLLFLCILALNSTVAEELLLKAKHTPDRPFTGNLRIDLFSQTELADVPHFIPDEGATIRHHKSPYIAAGLSLVVPGAGQFYTEHYWEAAAFLAADIAAWVLAVHYDKKGDKQTDFFQNYADGHWNVVDYGDYTQRNLVPLISDPDPNNRTFNWLIPGTEGLSPWLRVNWNELNRMERAVGSHTGNSGQYYSHTLPLHGEQQYYELIGKYQQFNQGWDDADQTPGSYEYGDPVTARFIYYGGERGKANDYYRNASTWVTLAIVNHVVNAAYAALSAGWYNSAHAELGMQRVPSDVGFADVPVLKMRLDF